MLAKCSCSIFSNGYRHSHLECCWGSHQSGCYTVGVSLGTELYRATHARAREHVWQEEEEGWERKSRCMAVSMSGVYMFVGFASRNSQQHQFVNVCLLAAWCFSVKPLPEWARSLSVVKKARVTVSTSCQVTAKSLWQQHGARIISGGECRSEHLTPRGLPLWETNVGTKWDGPWRGALFVFIMF